ncbi:hypothetical protein CBR_g29849 [Chara braunii]|uniref:Uncharacterized protein n=1 Tax=Chara braunii TaxID=69332 RepID=A0A388JWY3_CHABU|nr:hypothetical protein CBR_g29849 [Chara braunii]|eukprot:GBG62242.1 hypothetical protein CBR_g29849 [Chara braunii]
MVGGYGRREDGVAPAINTSNIFAALESRKRGKGKKKAAEQKKETPKKDSTSKIVLPEPTPSPAAAWVAPQVSVSGCWADAVDDDDSDGGLGPLPDWATPSRDNEPPASVETNEGEAEGVKEEEEEVHGVEEESDGDEDDHEDEADDDGEEEGEEDSSALSGRSPPTLSQSRFLSTPSTMIQPTPPERQLSKKELKKKEMEELEAVLLSLIHI